MKVYYFVEAQYAIENIRRRRLKACRFFDLNDPFELLAGEQTDKGFRKKLKNCAERLNSQYGLLCFSENWTNPLMWSHYGDRHRGMCLGFEVDDVLECINYSHQRLGVSGWKGFNLADPPKEVRQALLTTKYERWHYENEQRLIMPLADLEKDGKLFFKRFDHALRLVEVLAGPRCCAEWKPHIENAIKDLQVQPRLIKVRLAFKRFNVVKHKWGFACLGAWEQCGDFCLMQHDSCTMRVDKNSGIDNGVDTN